VPIEPRSWDRFVTGLFLPRPVANRPHERFAD
jgi:hypothetical protein